MCSLAVILLAALFLGPHPVLGQEVAPALPPVPLGFEASPEAETHIRKAVELLEDPSGLTAAGVEAVRAEFAAALALEPDNAQVHALWGRALLRLGADEEAAQVMDAFVGEHPDDSKGRRARAMLYVAELPRFDVAEEDLLWLSQRNEADTDVWTALGFARFQQGKFFSAKQAFREALVLDPQNLEAHNNLGWVAFKEGAQQKAKAHFERALAINPDYIGSHFGLAKLYEETGEIKAAINEYNVLLSMTPNFVYFLDLMILYGRAYSWLFLLAGAIVLALFVRTWVRVARRDKVREIEAAQYRPPPPISEN